MLHRLRPALILTAKCFGECKDGLPVALIHCAGEVTRQLQMLCLIFTYGHVRGAVAIQEGVGMRDCKPATLTLFLAGDRSDSLVEQNICCHENGIAKEAQCCSLLCITFSLAVRDWVELSWVGCSTSKCRE